MRKLIFISLLFLSFISFGQKPISRVIKSQVDSSFLPPVRDTTIAGTRAGELRMRPADNTLYLWNGTKWLQSAFNVSNLIPGRPNMRLVACVIAPTVVGSVMSWNFILNTLHDSIFVNTVRSDASTINIRYNATAGKIITAAITPDETLTAAGITCGASVGSDSMKISIFRPIGTKGAFLQGAGTTTWTVVNNSLNSYTWVSAGSYFQIQPNALPAYGAYAWSAEYAGTNGYKLQRGTAGYGGKSGVLAVRDFFGNALISNPTTDDIIQINTGDYYISTMNPSQAGGDGYVANVFSLFSNIWIIALIELP